MSNSIAHTPVPVNEPVRSYAPGSPERASLKKRLDEMRQTTVEIPIVIGGKEVRTGDIGKLVCPHDHHHVLGTYHQAGAAEVDAAAKAAREAWHDWSELAWEDRAAVFLRAADLLAGPHRDNANASTMLNQAKTVFQSEIDAAAELADFWRFNPYFARQIYQDQPISAPGMWNRVEYRALEGFVFAVSPFNFTSIGGNLASAPALMGCTALWKPASTAVYSNYYIFKILEAAGLPPGVINFIPGRASKVGDPVLAHPDFAGIHFTGSTEVFRDMWKTISGNLPKYRSYPRIVGETGGKNFVMVHASADPAAVVTALVRGGFEYQGQKCSAASRGYIPRSLWPRVEKLLKETVAEIAMGSPLDFRNFVSAVIDESSFDRIHGYIEYARNSPDAQVLIGGKADKSQGYFIEPTVVVTTDPRFKLMQEEIFGPVLTLFVYEDGDAEKTLGLVDSATDYALTGAVFAQDRRVIAQWTKALRHSSGNFYINDKPTGAVVGQQPFGGARASGTNDKAGSLGNLMRWTSQRALKETFVPPTDFRYPFMAAE